MLASVKHRFLLIHVTLLLIPISLMGTLITIFVWEEIEQRMLTEQHSVIQSIKQQVIDPHTRAMEKALTSLARNREIRRMLDEPAVRRRILEDWRLVQRIFPKRAWIYYGDTQNRIIVSPEWVPPPEYDLRVRPWYRAAREAGELAWVEPYAEYITNEMVFSVSIPIHDPQGNFTGVLGMDTFLENFLEGMRMEALEEETELLLVTPRNEGLVLTGGRQASLAKAYHYPWNQFFRQSERSGAVKLGGTHYHATYVNLEPLPFMLVSIIPRTAIAQEIRPVLSLIIILVLAAITFSGLGSFLVARYVTRNINSLNRYMHAVSGGDLTTRQCVSGRDEFLQLNRYLNSMVSTLAAQIASHRRTNDELDQRNRELDRLAHIDGLTHIFNRRYFTDTVQREWKRSRRERQPLALLFMDIDFFKQFNDRYGHSAGDECLRRIGELLLELARRPADLAARYGGEEFVILLPGTGREGAASLAETLREKVEALEIPHEESTVAPHLTCSIGLISTVATDASGVEAFIAAADRALYRAKREGRNRVVAGEL
jgi:diguanylate cyclase (GGDEF)-like protein